MLGRERERGEQSRSHEVFVRRRDAFAASRSITDDASAANAFANVKPKHHFQTDEGVQAELLHLQTVNSSLSQKQKSLL